jgi:hypothetical protein
MILLYHEATTVGMIATNDAKVAGESFGARRYEHNGHFVEIDGPEHVVAHDANEICKIPGYRLASPEETDAYMASKKKATSIKEGKGDK